MFDYELKGRQVILVLADALVERLRPLGVGGSPLLGAVHGVERSGLWLDAPAFGVCPADGPKVLDSRGQAVCHAHLFIPAEGIVSAVAFPDGSGPAPDDPNLHRIGSAPKAAG
ncbi:MAG: hypothetical protein HY928_01130 [Elusimicrobia bacterium]|nr:hypothetical protein [Elusimicrobiota bacterium]